MNSADRLSASELRKGVLAYREHEKRDAMYRVATYLVDQFWAEPRDLANGIGVLLLTWNQAHHRFGPPDLGKLEALLAAQSAELNSLRRREIRTLAAADDEVVARLFRSMLKALQIATGKNRGRESPVGAAKALHLLAPHFFPLWDEAIANAYHCSYKIDALAAYAKFMQISKDMAEWHRSLLKPLLDGKSALKVLDEYNYSKFTKGWI
jgi:hypothetical protein